MTPTPEAGRPGLRERKQRRTRQAIADAAIGLFSRHGFDAVTVTDIVERAEVAAAPTSGTSRTSRTSCSGTTRSCSRS